MTDNIPEQLKEYRERIDALDIELIDVLARRFEVVRAVGALKSQEALPVVQSARAEFVVKRVQGLGVAQGLDAGFVGRLYEMMIDHAHDLEHGIVADLEGACDE